jgi:hypothetical protein
MRVEITDSNATWRLEKNTDLSARPNSVFVITISVSDIYGDLTYRAWRRKVKQNRDQLTPFSAPSGPARSSETHSSTTNNFRVFSLAVSLPLLSARSRKSIMAGQFPASQNSLLVATQ